MKQFLEIGSLGWQHQAWQDHFYPEELPEEWQLTYYANEFRFVVVPAKDWHVADRETLEQWRDDVHEEFRFMFELTPESLAESRGMLDNILSVYAGVLIGFVYRESGQGLDDNQVVLQQLNQLARVYVDFGMAHAPGASQQSLLLQKGLAFCAYLDDEQKHTGAELGFIMSPESVQDKRKLSHMMQAFLTNIGKEGEFFVVFGGNPPPVQTMRDAVVIADLLGV